MQLRAPERVAMTVGSHRRSFQPAGPAAVFLGSVHIAYLQSGCLAVRYYCCEAGGLTTLPGSVYDEELRGILDRISKRKSGTCNRARETKEHPDRLIWVLLVPTVIASPIRLRV